MLEVTYPDLVKLTCRASLPIQYTRRRYADNAEAARTSLRPLLPAASDAIPPFYPPTLLVLALYPHVHCQYHLEEAPTAGLRGTVVLPIIILYMYSFGFRPVEQTSRNRRWLFPAHPRLHKGARMRIKSAPRQFVLLSNPNASPRPFAQRHYPSSVAVRPFWYLLT